ncbi:MAG: hypothetical protein J5673_03395 [Candidatus Methanomethylophilaceae archaeon]|nr:hypothetical protein [Candidatus Methanomethylophilaceae archaeon]
MLINPDLRYLDTCVMQMFADHRDPLRKYYNIRSNEIESSLIRNHGTLCISMPSLGESFCKIKDKCKGYELEIMEEINRLLDKTICVRYIRDAQETFGLAKRLSEDVDDDRNRVSPMDALIIATATVDPDCTTLYTTDSLLLSDARISEIINDWRENRGYRPMIIGEVYEIIKKR